jgi:uncharacterized C2H2 Zn-finger protein
LINLNFTPKFPCVADNGLTARTAAAELDAAIRGLIVTTLQGDGSTRLWTCVVCGKSGRKNDVIRHVEAQHLANHPGIACPECGKVSKTRNALRNHVYSVHNNKRALN